MKYLLILITFSINNVFACEVNLSNNFLFNYSYNEKTHIFSYTIEERNGAIFKFYQNKNTKIPKYFGFSVKNDSGNNVLNHVPNLEKNSLLIAKKFNNFYTEEGKFYNLMNTILLNESRSGLSFPIPKTEFISVKKINENINFEEFIKYIRHDTSNNYLFGKNIIKFKVKIVLDPEVKSCLSFDTKEYEYNFGSKFKWYFKDVFNIV